MLLQSRLISFDAASVTVVTPDAPFVTVAVVTSSGAVASASAVSAPAVFAVVVPTAVTVGC